MAATAPAKHARGKPTRVENWRIEFGFAQHSLDRARELLEELVHLIPADAKPRHVESASAEMRAQARLAARHLLAITGDDSIEAIDEDECVG